MHIACQNHSFGSAGQKLARPSRLEDMLYQLTINCNVHAEPVKLCKFAHCQ